MSVYHLVYKYTAKVISNCIRIGNMLQFYKVNDILGIKKIQGFKLADLVTKCLYRKMKEISYNFKTHCLVCWHQ